MTRGLSFRAEPQAESRNLFLHRFKVRIGFRGIKYLVAVHHRHEVLGIGEVDDVVGVAREHVDGLDVVAGDLELDDLVRVQPTLLDEPMPGDHDEELPFGVMPMLPLRDARLGDVDGHLACVQRMHELRERAAVIDIHLERERHLRGRKIAQVGRIQLLRERALRDVRDHQRPGLRGELVEQVDNLAQRRPVRRGHVAIAAVLHREHPEAVELAAVLLPAQAGDHLVHEVIDIQQLQLHRRVIDRIRQVVRHRVAERRHRGIVVGPTPFPEQVREPVNQYLSARVDAIVEEQLLPRLLAAAVLRVPEPARERRLLARAQHHRARVPMGPERIQQGRREPEVPRHELGGILRPVHPREIEHEIRFRAPRIQLRRRTVDVVLKHLVDGQFIVISTKRSAWRNLIVPRLPVPDILQLRAQVPTHETLRARHQDFHSTKIILFVISTERCIFVISTERQRAEKSPGYPPARWARTAHP